MSNSSSNTASRTFAAQLESLEKMMPWIRRHAIIGGLSSTAIRHVELAMEEAIVNIIRYAYPDHHGDIEISFKFTPKQKIEFTIKDRGTPFDPLQSHLEVDPGVSLEDREEGGLGILMIRQYMDELRYERKNECNILTLIKFLPKN